LKTCSSTSLGYSWRRRHWQSPPNSSKKSTLRSFSR